jgi:hypothetical protein
MGTTDRSYWVSVGAAVVAVLSCAFLLAPMVGMYLDTRETMYLNEITRKNNKKEREELEKLKTEIIELKESYGRKSQTKVDLPNGSNLHGN